MKNHTKDACLQPFRIGYIATNRISCVKLKLNIAGKRSFSARTLFASNANVYMCKNYEMTFSRACPVSPVVLATIQNIARGTFLVTFIDGRIFRCHVGLLFACASAYVTRESTVLAEYPQNHLSKITRFTKSKAPVHVWVWVITAIQVWTPFCIDMAEGPSNRGRHKNKVLLKLDDDPLWQAVCRRRKIKRKKKRRDAR